MAVRPSAPRRRRQVLDAAEDCFRTHGFHATSMAQIAAAAKMSVGHIYRYFPGKDDIIAAVVERDVCSTVAGFDALAAEPQEIFPTLFRRWREKFERLGDRSNSRLWLEILAESARNPSAAKVMCDTHETLSKCLCGLVEAGAPGRWSPEEIREKVEMLIMLMNAAALRTIIDPKMDCRRSADQSLGLVESIFARSED